MQRHYLSVFVVAFVGLALIAMAAPRAIGGLYLAPHDQVLRQIGYKKPVAAAELRAATRAHVTALSYWDNGKTRVNLGSLYLAQAQRAPANSRERAAFLALAERALRAGLKLSPSNPFGWAQLAHVMYARGDADKGFSEIYRTAIALAPVAPRLALPRSELGLTAWRSLDDKARAALAGQIRLAAMYSPDELARTVWRIRALGPARALLKSDQEALRRFDRAYLSL